MKNGKVFILLFVIVGLILIGYFFPTEKDNPEYLRIHIRANSNTEIDQSVKYKVRDSIVNYLTPIIAEQKNPTKESAQKLIESKLADIENVANSVLNENGFDYKSSARIKNELFPTRVYEDLTLDSGYYDALILNLGSGEGDNWWCVVYPPLCFKNTNYIYKSKILEIIKSFKEKQ